MSGAVAESWCTFVQYDRTRLVRPASTRPAHRRRRDRRRGGRGRGGARGRAVRAAAWRCSSARRCRPLGGSSKGTRADLRPGGLSRTTSYLDAGAARARALARDRGGEPASGCCGRPARCTRGGFAERELEALRAAGVEAERLTAADAQRRFGVALPGDGPLVHQPDAGVIRADRARAALLRAGAGRGSRAARAASACCRWPTAATRSRSRPTAARWTLLGGDRRRRPVEPAGCWPAPGSSAAGRLAAVGRLLRARRPGRAAGRADRLRGRRAVRLLGPRARAQGRASRPRPRGRSGRRDRAEVEPDARSSGWPSGCALAVPGHVGARRRAASRPACTRTPRASGSCSSATVGSSSAAPAAARGFSSRPRPASAWRGWPPRSRRRRARARGERAMSARRARLDDCLSVRDGALFVEGCAAEELARALRHPALRRLRGPAAPQRAAVHGRVRRPLAGRVSPPALDQGQLGARAAPHPHRRGHRLRRLRARTSSRRRCAPGTDPGADLAQRRR